MDAANLTYAKLYGSAENSQADPSHQETQRINHSSAKSNTAQESNKRLPFDFFATTPKYYGFWAGGSTLLLTYGKFISDNRVAVGPTLKFAGAFGLLISMNAEVIQHYEAVRTGKETMGEAIGDGVTDVGLGVVSGMAGAYLGAKIGVAAGSWGGPVGVAAGFVLGGIIGWGLTMAKESLMA